MTGLSGTPLRSAPAMLRPLSGFERLFLALDKINGLTLASLLASAVRSQRGAGERLSSRCRDDIRCSVRESTRRIRTHLTSRAGRMFRYRLYISSFSVSPAFEADMCPAN
jgi:hypothetical protein